MLAVCLAFGLDGRQRPTLSTKHVSSVDLAILLSSRLLEGW